MTVDNLKIQHANTLYNLDYLASIEVTGEDAPLFLQGQLTCNVNEINLNKANIAAFCNPKGRVISVLLIIKIQSGFLLLLPRGLLDKVIGKLRMYVLRSKVQLTDKSDSVSLYGLYQPNDIENFSFPVNDFHCSFNDTLLCIKLPSPSPRFLCISDKNARTTLTHVNFKLGSGDEWRYQDISTGLPWFEAEQSEQFIPQMLNIDQLGGISFNKGCYTGQEVIARTHYLGKAKRQLYLAECQGGLHQACAFAVKHAETQEKLGDVLTTQTYAETTRLLMVLQTVDAKTKNLILNDSAQTPLTLIPL